MWKQEFESVGARKFFPSKGKEIQVEMTYDEKYNFKLDPNHKNCQSIEIPVKNSDFRFFIQCPNNFESDLTFDSELLKIFDNLPVKKGSLTVPTFSLNSDIDLNKILVSMGYFVDFGVLKQKTNLTFSTKGFVAASATAANPSRGLSFHAANINKPFFIWIVYKNILIFQAYIRNPQS